MIGDIFSVFLSLPDTFGEKVFNLSVDGAKVVLCPGGNGRIKFGGQPQRNLLFFLSLCHILVQTAGVDYRLGIVVAAEHHEKVGDHSGLTFFIQRYHTALI